MAMGPSRGGDILIIRKYLILSIYRQYAWSDCYKLAKLAARIFLANVGHE